MFEKIERLQLVLLAIILAFGIFFATKYATNSVAKEDVTVTGSAYKIVKSDSGKLHFSIIVKAPTKALAYTKLKNQLPIVKTYLTDKGFENIEIKPTNGYYN